MPQTLFHFSEDPNIGVFRPHHARGREDEDPYVWAIDAQHAPLYWFPRECPRITFWADACTTATDRERFLGFGSAERVHVTESGWLARMRAVKLYAYHFGPEPFELYPDPGGFWVARSKVVPKRCEAVGDLLARHAEARIELRFTPSLEPLQLAVATSSLGFSMVRLRNAAVAAWPAA
jgi:hypothetical protein